MESGGETPLTMEVKTFSSANEQPTINYRGIKAMPYILGNETFEKLGAMGTASNLFVFLMQFFNLKHITAIKVMSVFGGTANFAPLFGAFLSDSYFGRYKIIGFASICSLLGMSMLTLTATIDKLHPPTCQMGGVATCVGPSPMQLTFLFVSFGFLIIGAGGIRPCNLAFGADQFNPNTESGKRGISSFINWYNFTFTLALMVSVTLLVHIQSNVSWSFGLGIPTCLMLVSIVIFFMGSRIYVKVKPEGSPLTSVAQVLVAAIKNRRLKLSEDDAHLRLFNYLPPNSIISVLPYTEHLRFLNKAAILTSEDQINIDGSPVNPWKLCSIQQVEEVKCVMRVLPIWASAILYHVAINQQASFGVLQALQADRHVRNGGYEVPSASFAIFQMISLTIWIPIYDRIVVPLLRKFTGREGGLTLLQRMGTGLFLTTVALLVSATTEEYRKHLAPTNTNGPTISSMSAFWLVPQLAITGLAEGFNSVGQMEFYYQQLPENMRSVAGAFYFCGMATASYVDGLLVSLVHEKTKGGSEDWLAEDLNKGKLEYYYYLITALGVLNFIYFLVCAYWYRYKGDGENNVQLRTQSDKDFI
ncbi:hypothetical protein ACFE04_027912 [Oxalis oulophora]